MKKLLFLGSLALTAGAFVATDASAQQRPAPDPRDMGGGRCAANVYNCADTPNPLAEAETVWIEEMTWMDVRDAIAAGKTTAVIPTGGMEPNGPWLVTGKHNYVLHTNCEAIARELGDALCAPIIPYVPEGSINPKSGHMTSPGTISAREETFRGLLRDVARSLQAHGFENIVFIGDSGGNQGGQQAVAAELNAMWGSEATASQVREYYDYASVTQYMAEEHGFVAGESDNMHDDPVITLNMFIDDPWSVRWQERVDAGLATINGVSIEDRVETLEMARRVVDFRAKATSRAIRSHIAAGGTQPPEPSAGRGGRGGPPAGFQRPEPDPRDMGGGQCRQNQYNCADTPNPLPEAETVWLEEMTWMDVRDAVAAGKTTAIIATGGMEPNGPWLATGKHNYVLRANCDAIARNLGNAVCAPIVKWVPEGDIDARSGHMGSPGTISIAQETFEGLLTDIASSLQAHGFENIVFIGDSGGNQRGQAAVAEALTAAWGGAARAHQIGEYYPANPDGQRNVLREMGIEAEGQAGRDGLHDNPTITLNMMAADIESVRWTDRVAAGQDMIDGVSVANLHEALNLAREIVDARAARTADAIRRHIGR